MRRLVLSVAAVLALAVPAGAAASTGLNPPADPWQSWMVDAHQHVPWPKHTINLSVSYCGCSWQSVTVQRSTETIYVSAPDPADPSMRPQFFWGIGILYGQDVHDYGDIGPGLAILGYDSWGHFGAQDAFGTAYSRCARWSDDRNPQFCQWLPSVGKRKHRGSAGLRVLRSRVPVR